VTFEGACAAGVTFEGICAAGIVFVVVCADCALADAAKPRLSSAAVVVPIKRLNVIDAVSVKGRKLLVQRSNRDPNAKDAIPDDALVYKTSDYVLWEFCGFLVD
jgi:hypothetical protein